MFEQDHVDLMIYENKKYAMIAWLEEDFCLNTSQ